MNDLNQRCVSLATGVLSPDLRVNYELGMVLGVTEFRQDALYQLAHEYLQYRAMHGYGTASGLLVEATRPSDDLREIQIAVKQGIGVDQWGRPFVVRTDQCARLGAWLARQPDTWRSTIGPSGSLTVYVVAAYDECYDALVAIPGQPCSSSDATQAPSRIRDAHAIDFRWQPPPMPAWDAVRRFARLLAAVRIEPLLPPINSDEPEIIELVRLLDQPTAYEARAAGLAAGSPPNVLQLPAETAREALDRIFTVWVTEVRPRLAPSLIQPDQKKAGGSVDDPGILLARIDFVPADPFSATSPEILHVSPPSNEGRPFLLHTQLIQELLLLGEGGDIQVQPSVPERELATLRVVAPQTVRVWVHHPATLATPPVPGPSLVLRSDTRTLTIQSIVARPELPNLFDLTLPAASAIAPAERVELRFNVAAMTTQNGQPLRASMSSLGVDYLDRDGDTIRSFATADLPLPARDLVTLDVARLPAGIRLVAWFHTADPVRLPSTISVTRNLAAAAETFQATPRGGGQFARVWELTPTNGVPLANDDLLAIRLPTEDLRVGTSLPASTTLTTAIRGLRASVVGFDDVNTLNLFHAVELAPLPAPPPPPFVSRPPLELVSLTPRGLVNQGTRMRVELWFHLDPEPEQDTTRIVLRDLGEARALITVLVEQQGALGSSLGQLDIQAINEEQNNVFSLDFQVEQWRALKSRPYLRFLFNPKLEVESLSTGAPTLGDFIKDRELIIVGADPDPERPIVAYVRVGDLPG